jgi:hypothetical protein
MAKKLLILSVVSLGIGLAFVTGLVDAQHAVDLYVVLPLGAVFLGLFLVFKSFEKEVSLYDTEQHTHPAFRAALTTEKPCDCSIHSHGKPAAAR